MRKKSTARKFVDIGIYCVSVILLFFAVILILREAVYVPDDVYTDPPPPPPASTHSLYVPKNSPPVSAMPTYGISTEPNSENTPQTHESPKSDASPEKTGESKPQSTRTQATPTPPLFGEDDIYPVKLYFIERKVSCDVLPVALKNNQMETIRSAYDSGWLYVPPYVVPGEVGTAIIAGHNRWSGKNGTFSVLKKMSPGETVAVEMNDGYARYFVVDEIYECPYDDNTPMQTIDDGLPHLILITCKGDWDRVLHTSKTRVVARCSPME